MKINLTFLLIAAVFFTTETQAQEVAKRIVVEHYTNTRCGICANRNPAFFTNLENHPDIYHIAIYPSAPYPSCILHQHNTNESNARTQAYNIFGGTPRLVIQGSPISAGSNYGSATIFDSHEDQVTPISLDVIQSKTADELLITLVVKAETDNNIGNATLFIAAVEQLIGYDAPNGETEHPNVFRKTLNGEAVGEPLAVPAIAGDSLVLTYSTMSDEAWDFDKIYAMAILQDAADLGVIQVDASEPSDNVVISATKEVNTLAAEIFPNPVQNTLQIRLPETTTTIMFLYNIQGQLLHKASFEGQQHSFDTSKLPKGIYWLHLTTENGLVWKKVVKG